MSFRAIAKKDIQDSIRSRLLWGVIVTFFLLVFVLSWLVIDSSAQSFEAAAGLSFILGILFFVPMAGLMISVKSIIRERETGSINILLSLPHSRAEMVAGKFVGRTAVLSVAIVVGFLPSLLFAATQVEGFPGYEILSFLVATVFFGVLFVGIGVGFSALVNSETQATIGSVIIFFLLYLWPFIIENLGVDLPAFVSRFWLFTLFFDMWFTLLTFRDEASPTGSTIADAEEFALDVTAGTSADIHMQLWFAFVILAIWVAVPLAIGTFRFVRMDL